MNGKDLFNAIGNIDDKYISEFADASQFKKKMPFFLSPKFYSGIAAVFVIGIAVLIALQMNQKPIDIQNNSLNNAAANSYGSKSDIPPVTENAAKVVIVSMTPSPNEQRNNRISMPTHFLLRSLPTLFTWLSKKCWKAS